jgi:hypothetical protein
MPPNADAEQNKRTNIIPADRLDRSADIMGQ